MITLSYTAREMELALVKAGYEIRREELKADWYDTRGEDDTEYTRITWMVYFAGECVTSGTKFDRLYGYERMSEIFQSEVKRRILGLF